MNDILSNNLNELNQWLKNNNNKFLVLHLIGGYALFLKGFCNRFTIDIDNVSEILDQEIIDKIHEIGETNNSPDWFDFGASSISLPDNYKIRLFKEKGHSNIEIFTLSKEDLLALKVGAYLTRREKTQRDLADIISIGPSRKELDQAFHFVQSEYGKELHGKFLKEFNSDLEEIRREIENAIKR